MTKVLETKDAWPRAYEVSTYCICPFSSFKEVCILRMSLLLCQDPLTGCLVVWWDLVMATLKSVQFQTKLTDPIRMELNLNLALAVP